MNETLITIFIVIAAIAIVVQMAVLIALYASVRKSSARMEAVATQLEEHGVPALRATRAFLEENGPRMKALVEDAAATAALLRSQVERVDGTVTELVDRTRLQAIRVDELVSRTLDRVETTTELVQHTVISPVRRAAGLIEALKAGAQAFIGRSRGRSRSPATEDEEMFI